MEELKPEKKTDWRDGKHPLSVRIKTPEKVKFMEALIIDKGNSQAALDHCVTVAMVGGGATSPDMQKVISLSADRAAKITELTNQIAGLKHEIEQRQPSNGPSLFDDAMLKALAALKAKKKFTTDADVVRYALTYVLKNDWL